MSVGAKNTHMQNYTRRVVRIFLEGVSHIRTHGCKQNASERDGGHSWGQKRAKARNGAAENNINVIINEKIS